MNTHIVQAAKETVRALHAEFDATGDSELAGVLARHTTADYRWRGMHPFYEQSGAGAAVNAFWLPLRHSLRHLQRREDVFMAGRNDVDGGETVWVAGMGHIMGLFDNDWLDIPATRRMAFLRYAEFHRVELGKIAESVAGQVGVAHGRAVDQTDPLSDLFEHRICRQRGSIRLDGFEQIIEVEAKHDLCRERSVFECGALAYGELCP